METSSYCSSHSSEAKKLKQTLSLTVPTSSVDDPSNRLIDFEQENEDSDNLDDKLYDDDDSYYEDGLIDEDDGLIDEDFSSYDDTLSLQKQFDAADLPPDVEATIPWLDLFANSDLKSAATGSSSTSSSSNNKGKKGEGEITLQKRTRIYNSSASCTLMVPGTSNFPLECEDDDLKNFETFKRFDTVKDFSDHQYRNEKCYSKQGWSKAIHHEWKILEKDLPETIFVRVYEERMDLLRAVIVGAAGTPYHDGIFFFDLIFPPDYPNVPPKVHYHSGGLRLNPNLYNCGKVCLSLLNTWHGQKDEKWTPGKSTVLQVLLSIQALVLNEKPYFNEPGYEKQAGGMFGEANSKNYNEETFILSCKTMLYTLRRPPKHFEVFVAGHFRIHAYAIMEACEAYIMGGRVGCDAASIDQGTESDRSMKFKQSVGEIATSLVPEFIKNGAKDCEKFIPLGDLYRTVPLKKVKDASTQPPPITANSGEVAMNS
ncbi:hypothetical protein Scep_028351 [Stephania cephalantha]|uniref:E2 ubiquitin-conjugating enzyme n=1 Tax=Stephania cephalantha TaxID=152367 RepID=A0AAP0E9S8_9MAGN